jgi:hypothetical protein
MLRIVEAVLSFFNIVIVVITVGRHPSSFSSGVSYITEDA